MFQFPAFAPTNVGDRPSACRVTPFGHLRINSCLQIPGAFRSLPRPSSLSEAKASSVRSSSLSLCESLCDFKSQSVFTRLPYEIVALNNSKKLELFTDYNSFTSLSLSIFSKILIVPPFQRGCKGKNFFLICKFFLKYFSQKKHFKGQTPPEVPVKGIIP